MRVGSVSRAPYPCIDIDGTLCRCTHRKWLVLASCIEYAATFDRHNRDENSFHRGILPKFSDVFQRVSWRKEGFVLAHAHHDSICYLIVVGASGRDDAEY